MRFVRGFIIPLFAISSSYAIDFASFFKTTKGCNHDFYKDLKVNTQQMRELSNKLHDSNLSSQKRKYILETIGQKQGLLTNFAAAEDILKLAQRAGQIKADGKDFKFIFDRTLNSMYDLSLQSFDKNTTSEIPFISKTNLGDPEIALASLRKLGRAKWDMEVTQRLNDMLEGRKPVWFNSDNLGLVSSEIGLGSAEFGINATFKLGHSNKQIYKQQFQYDLNYLTNFNAQNLNSSQEQIVESLASISAYLKYLNQKNSDAIISAYEKLASPLIDLIKALVQKPETSVEGFMRDFAYDTITTFMKKLGTDEQLEKRILDGIKQANIVEESDIERVLTAYSISIGKTKEFLEIYTKRETQVIESLTEALNSGLISGSEIRLTKEEMKSLKKAKKLVEAKSPELMAKGHELYNMVVISNRLKI